MGELVDDAAKVAEAVSVVVLEASRVDLPGGRSSESKLEKSVERTARGRDGGGGGKAHLVQHVAFLPPRRRALLVYCVDHHRVLVGWEEGEAKLSAGRGRMKWGFLLRLLALLLYGVLQMTGRHSGRALTPSNRQQHAKSHFLTALCCSPPPPQERYSPPGRAALASNRCMWGAVETASRPPSPGVIGPSKNKV